MLGWSVLSPIFLFLLLPVTPFSVEGAKTKLHPSQSHTPFSSIATSLLSHGYRTVTHLRLLHPLPANGRFYTFVTHHTHELYGHISPMHLLLGLQAHPESDSRVDPVHVRRPSQGRHRRSGRLRLRLRQEELLL